MIVYIVYAAENHITLKLLAMFLLYANQQFYIRLNLCPPINGKGIVLDKVALMTHIVTDWYLELEKIILFSNVENQVKTKMKA